MFSFGYIVFGGCGEAIGSLDGFAGVDVLYDSSEEKGNCRRSKNDSERGRYKFG